MAKLKLDKPPGVALRALLRRQFAKAVAELQRAAASGHVHDARRSLKALRSTLRLARPAIGETDFKAADRVLSKAGRRLAGARHGEAMVETAVKLAHDGVAAAAEAFRAKAVTSAEGTGGIAADAAEALADILKLRKAARRWALPASDLKGYVEGLAASYGRARRILRKGLRRHDSELLHESRKSVIHHLHHVEALSGLWPAVFAAWLRDLNRLRLALGDLNDIDDLERILVMELTADAQAAIALRRQRLMATIAELGGVVFAERPKAYARRMEAMWRHAIAAIEGQSARH